MSQKETVEGFLARGGGIKKLPYNSEFEEVQITRFRDFGKGIGAFLNGGRMVPRLPDQDEQFERMK